MTSTVNAPRAPFFLSLLAFELRADAAAAAGADTSAAHEAEVARAWAALPGARFCLLGALSRAFGDGPERAQGALVGFDDAEAPARWAAGEAPCAELARVIAPGSIHVESIEANEEIPLAPRTPERRFYALVATFDYAPGPGDARAAERHYLDVHVPRSRELPGLRGYLTGRIAPRATSGAPRQRMGVEIFDDKGALAAAFRTPVGKDVRRDGEYVCANVRVYHLDGRIV